MHTCTCTYVYIQVCVEECPTANEAGIRVDPVCVDSVNTTQFDIINSTTTSDIDDVTIAVAVSLCVLVCVCVCVCVCLCVYACVCVCVQLVPHVQHMYIQ